jgi:hypothetical protein
MMDDDVELSNNVWKNPGIAEAVKERRRLGEETKSQILLLILKSEPEGMTTHDLVKATGRNRRTVHGICRDYQKKGFINEKTGKYGKYHLSSKALRIDDPSRGPLLLQSYMLRTQLFELGEVALSSSMEFFDSEYSKRILKNQMGIDNTKEKEALQKLYLFEFALRWGSLILYMLIQSMKYSKPSLHINESMRNHLMTKRLETVVNPFILGDTFEEFLLILYEKIWKGQKSKQEDVAMLPTQDVKIDSINEKILKERSHELESIKNKIMEERFEEMESIYKKTFPIVSDLIGNLQYDMVYDHGFLEREEEQRDPNHIECVGELMPMIYVEPDGRKVKQCSRCKRLIPVEDSEPHDLES